MANGDTPDVVSTRPDPEVTTMTPGAAAALEDPGLSATQARSAMSREMIEEYRRLGKQESDIYAAREQEEAPLRADLTAAVKAYGETGRGATAALLRSGKDIPEYKTPDIRGDAMTWMSLAAGFGALAGAFSRYHTTTALNAFGAAMTGFAKGKLEVFDQKYKEWEASATRAREINARAVREYTAIMQNAKLNLDQRSMLMQMTADKYQDQLMSTQAQMKNITGMTQLMDGQQRYEESLKLRQDAMAEHKREFDERMKQGVEQFYGTSEDSQSIADQILSMASPPPSPAAQGRYPYLRKAMQIVMQKNPAYQPADYAANTARKRLAATGDVTAINAALREDERMLASIGPFEQNAKRAGDIITQLVDRVDQTGTPVFERWTRAGRKATGDPDVAMFDAQVSIYSTEVARILNNPKLLGQLTDSARHEIQAWLPQDITAGQIKRVVPLLDWEMDNRKRGIEDGVNYYRGALEQIKAGQGVPKIVQTPQAPPPIAPSTGPTTDDLYIEQ